MLKRFLLSLVLGMVDKVHFLLVCYLDGVSDRWLRGVYGELVQLELLEWTAVTPDVSITCESSTLLVKDRANTFSINQNKCGDIYVHWLGEEHDIDHAGLERVKTSWHEIYRSHGKVVDTHFFDLLRKIIADGDYALREQE